MEISKKLKLMRKENNLTLKELSTKSGISISFISDIENGRRNPSIEKLKILARALNIPAGEFLKEGTDYLINGGENNNRIFGLNRDSEDMLNIYGGLNSEEKEKAKTFLKFLHSQNKK